MRGLITWGLFPITFAASLGVAWWGIGAGVSEPLLLAGISATVAALIAVMERAHPYIPAWNRARGDVGTDTLHLVVSMLVLPQVIDIVLRAALLGVSVWLAERTGLALWPTGWPLAMQLALALIVSQFGEYWVHRLMHTRPLLWRLHATHHSPERLYWLNAARFHPLDTAASYTVATAPLLVLGVPPAVLLLFTVWVSVHGMFQHCNIDVRLGPLNWIFSMAELHRWHHSLDLTEANANYGNNILLWDIVFGTVYWPRDRRASEHIGLHDMPDFPRDYLGQLASPVRWPVAVDSRNG